MSAPALRLVRCDDEPARPDGLSAAMTIPEFWEAHYRPHLEAGGSQPSTIERYGTSVSHWGRLVGPVSLAQVSTDHGRHYIVELSARNLSPNTIFGHRNTIARIVHTAGEGSRTGPVPPAGLIGPVWFPPVRCVRRTPRAWELSEIGAWLDALAAVTQPRRLADWGIEPADWWRSLVLFGYNTGLRLNTILALRWDWVDGSMVDIPASAIKGGHADERKPLNRFARAAARAIRTDHPRLFPWPCSESRLDRLKRKHFDLAGISDARRRSVNAGKFFHGLRTTCITELSVIDPHLASLLHGERTMTARHYKDLARLANAMEQMPQPQQTNPYPAAERQLMLF